MSQTNHRPTNDVLDLATAALRGARGSETVPRPLVAVTIEMLNSQFTGAGSGFKSCLVVGDSAPCRLPEEEGFENEDAPGVVQLQNERRQRMFRMARYGSLAAAILLAVFATSALWLLDRGASTAFGQVANNVRQAMSVSFTQRSVMPLGQSFPVLTLDFKVYLQGDDVRIEIPATLDADETKTPFTEVAVANLHTKKVLRVDYSEKKAEKSTIDQDELAKYGSPVKALSSLTDKDAELIGEEQLDGLKTKVYRLRKSNFPLGPQQVGELEEGESVKVWVDSKTNLPAQISIETFSDPDHKFKCTSLMKNFVWNKPLNPKPFKLEIPDGFKVIERSEEGDQGANAVGTDRE